MFFFTTYWTWLPFLGALGERIGVRAKSTRQAFLMPWTLGGTILLGSYSLFWHPNLILDPYRHFKQETFWISLVWSSFVLISATLEKQEAGKGLLCLGLAIIALTSHWLYWTLGILELLFVSFFLGMSIIPKAWYVRHVLSSLCLALFIGQKEVKIPLEMLYWREEWLMAIALGAYLPLWPWHRAWCLLFLRVSLLEKGLLGIFLPMVMGFLALQHAFLPWEMAIYRLLWGLPLIMQRSFSWPLFWILCNGALGIGFPSFSILVFFWSNATVILMASFLLDQPAPGYGSGQGGKLALGIAVALQAWSTVLFLPFALSAVSIFAYGILAFWVLRKKDSFMSWPYNLGLWLWNGMLAGYYAFF